MSCRGQEMFWWLPCLVGGVVPPPRAPTQARAQTQKMTKSVAAALVADNNLRNLAVEASQPTIDNGQEGRLMNIAQTNPYIETKHLHFNILHKTEFKSFRQHRK